MHGNWNIPTITNNLFGATDEGYRCESTIIYMPKLLQLLYLPCRNDCGQFDDYSDM